jgi:transposase
MKKNNNNLTLDSKAVGALPIINQFIDRLDLYRTLNQNVSSKKNQKISNADSILIFVRNILIERKPLYGLSEWAAHFDSQLIGLKEAKPSALNDDRVGRSLNHLFDADRATLLTEIVLKAIAEFDIDTFQLHNDSTTVTVYGEYKGEKSVRKGKTSIALKRGHNKDFRPDLKQLLFTLTVSRDGAVPIHYKSFDGNTTDDKTHIYIWESLRRITGRSDFIYVADSKLFTKKQTKYITNEGGKFISILPETRKECTWFKTWFKSYKIKWQELFRRPDNRSPESNEHIYWGYESPMPTNEGFRIIWILSSQKQEQDNNTRSRRIENTIEELTHLKDRVGKRNLKSKEQISDAVCKVFENNKSSRWFDWKMVKEEIESFKQKGKGRPGKNTEFIRVVNERWTFEAMPNGPKIQENAETDGIFPIVTNITEKELSMKAVLLKYKYQPYIEKRHQQFKSVLEAAPVYLKSPHRIEALMFVYFIALLLNALIERELRLSMKKNKIKELPLYPEERDCKYPTTNRLITLFSNQRRHILKEGNETIKYFFDHLSELQIQILKLLGVDAMQYKS